MVRSVRIHDFGGPEVLRIEDVETEQPGGGEVRLRTRAIGINEPKSRCARAARPQDPPYRRKSAGKPRAKSRLLART